MVDLTRRFFLGGAISLIAAQTSALPKIIGNMPQIWGDGRHDDTGGLGSLFRGEPVVFTKDRLTIDSHKGITFHKGIFTVSRTIEIPDECNLTMDGPTFKALGLPIDSPFFRAALVKGENLSSGHNMPRVWFRAPSGQAPFIEYPNFDGEAEFEEEMLGFARDRAAA
jgi:hypothetical protein